MGLEVTLRRPRSHRRCDGSSESEAHVDTASFPERTSRLAKNRRSLRRANDRTGRVLVGRVEERGSSENGRGNESSHDERVRIGW